MLDLDPKDYVLSLSTGDDDPIDGTFSAFEAENDPGALDEVARWIEEGAKPGDTLTVGGGAAPLETWTIVRTPVA